MYNEYDFLTIWHEITLDGLMLKSTNHQNIDQTELIDFNTH